MVAGRLSGRAAIVTGAGRRIGIGTAVCRALAVDGADIFITDWSAYDAAMPWGTDADGPDELMRELSEMGVRSHYLAADLTLAETPAAIFDAAESVLGPVSILVNNATYSTDSDVATLDADVLDRHYLVNLRGTALLSVEFARRFRGGTGGRIINLTSGQSLGPMPGELAYAATKGAVEAFTRSLSAGVAALGITVNAINPGPTDTGWMSEELKAALLPRFPLGRIGQPVDAARLVALLASDDAAWVTGQVIHSEGGFLR